MTQIARSNNLPNKPVREKSQAHMIATQLPNAFLEKLNQMEQPPELEPLSSFILKSG